MKATLTNLGSVPVPLTSTDGLAESLIPGVSFTLDDADITVCTVGENPSFLEDLEEAVGEIAKKAIALITFWKAHPDPQDAGNDPVVRVQIVTGPNMVRVTGDDKSQDHDMQSYETFNASGEDYIELRLLGIDNQAPVQEAP